MGLSIIQQAQELYSLVEEFYLKTSELNTGNITGKLVRGGNGITLCEQGHLGFERYIYINKEDTEALYEWLKMLHKES